VKCLKSLPAGPPSLLCLPWWRVIMEWILNLCRSWSGTMVTRLWWSLLFRCVWSFIFFLSGRGGC